MPNIGIIFLIVVLMFYLIIELEHLADKIRSKMFLSYPDDEFFDENDFSGLPFMSGRDFSGDDDRNKRTNGDSRLTEEQSAQLLLPKIAETKPPTKKIEKKPPVKVEEPEVEDVEFEFKTVRAKKKRVKKKK